MIVLYVYTDHTFIAVLFARLFKRSSVNYESLVPWIFSEYVDCNMRRKGYVSSANVMKVNVSFDAVTVSSSIKCAMLSLRQGNSTIGFLYDRVASSCRGIRDLPEPSEDEIGVIEYYVLTCRESEIQQKEETPSIYLGCYHDDIPHDLSGPSVSFPSDNTPEKCRLICQMSGYPYAAVQDRTECFCGDSYGNYGSVPETECNAPCPGDASQMCGGAWTNSVYSTDTN